MYILLSAPFMYEGGRYRVLALDRIPLILCYAKLMFYLELEDVLKFLAIVLFAICCQVPGRRLSDDFFIPKGVAQTFVLY